MKGKELLNQISNVILASATTPDQAIEYFLTNMLEKIKYISIFYPRRKVESTNLLKEKLIPNKLENVNNFIEIYNETVVDITLQWVSLAKKWGEEIIGKALLEASKKFKMESFAHFKDMSEAALNHADNLEFILTHYDLSEKEEKTLTEKRSQLIKISKMTYDKFVNDLKNNSEISEI